MSYIEFLKLDVNDILSFKGSNEDGYTLEYSLHFVSLILGGRCQ